MESQDLPGGRSAEYLLVPVTVQLTRPPLLRKSEQTCNIFLGKCPMIIPSFFTATAYLSFVFCGSCSQDRTSPVAAS